MQSCVHNITTVHYLLTWFIRANIVT